MFYVLCSMLCVLLTLTIRRANWNLQYLQLLSIETALISPTLRIRGVGASIQQPIVRRLFSKCDYAEETSYLYSERWIDSIESVAGLDEKCRMFHRFCIMLEKCSFRGRWYIQLSQFCLLICRIRPGTGIIFTITQNKAQISLVAKHFLLGSILN